MDTTKKIIKFEAIASGFDKVAKQIENLTKKTSDVVFPPELEQGLKRIKTILESVRTSTASASNNNFLGAGQTKATIANLHYIESEMTSILKLFADFGITKQASEAMKQYLKDVEKLEQSLKRVESSRPRTRVEESGVLTKAGKVSAFRETSFKNIGDKGGVGWVTIDGKKYNTYDKLLSAVRSDPSNANLNKVLAEVDARMQENTAAIEGYIKKQNDYIKAVNDAKKALETQKSKRPTTTPLETEFLSISDEKAKITEQVVELSKNLNDEEDRGIEIEEQHNVVLAKKNKTLGKTVIAAYMYRTALNFVRQSVTEATETIKTMDEALTGMAVVTSMSREEAWQLVGEFQNLAQVTGKTTSEIASMATKFYQQGKTTAEVLALTEAAAKAATIAGIDGAQSIDLLTNAMNGFQLASTKAMEVSDKFAALAAASATDYEELATALSKVAAQANLAGMSMDFTLGLLAKGIEVTREAPETIGTALKTVISRMRELTDYGKTLEDNMDVNRVAAALDTVGIKLMGVDGQFRDLEEVLTEVGQKWNTLNKNQQANIAVAMAGTRQQSRFIAMMQDFDRTLELVNISSNSYGATLAQQAKYMEGLEAKMTLLSNAYERLVSSVVNSDAVIWVIERATTLLEFAADNMWAILVPLGLIGAHWVANTAYVWLYNKAVKRQQKEDQKEVLKQMKLEKSQLKQKFEGQETTLKAEHALQKAEQQRRIDNAKNHTDELKATGAEIKAKYNLAIANAQASGNDSEVIKLQQAKNTALKEHSHLVNNSIKSIALEEQAMQALEIKQKSELETLQQQQAQYKENLDLQIAQNEITADSSAGFKQLISVIASGLFVKQADLSVEKLKNGAITKQIKLEIQRLGVILLITAAIAALVTGIKMVSDAWSKYNNNVTNTLNELEKLQVQLYNIQQEQKAVHDLGNEFQSLSDKIALSTDELERQQAIIQEINSTAGYQVVDPTAPSAVQASQIRAYETSKQYEARGVTQAMSDTIAEGYKTAKSGDEAAKWATGLGVYGGSLGLAGGIAASIGIGTALTAAGATLSATGIGALIGLPLLLAGGLAIAGAAGGSAIGSTTGDWDADEQKRAYIEELMSKESAQQAVKQYAQANIDGLNTLSNSMQEAVLNMTVDAANELESGIIGESGIDITKFAEDIANETLFSALRSVEASETIVESWEAVKNLSNEQKRLLGAARSDLGALFTLEKQGISVDKLVNQLNAQTISMSKFSEAYQQTGQFLKLFGKTEDEVSQILAESLQKFGEGKTLSQSMSTIFDNLKITKEQVAEAQSAISAIEDGTTFKFEAGTLAQEQAALEEIEDKNSEEFQKRNQVVQDALAKINEYNQLIDTYVNQDLLKLDQQLYLLSLDYPIESASNFADQLTNLNSKFERITKAMSEWNDMDISEQLKLLQDYPMLAQEMLAGTLTADSIYEAMREDYESTAQNVITSQSNINKQVQSLTGGGTLDLEKALKISNMTNADIAELYGIDASTMSPETYEKTINLIAGYAKEYIEQELIVNNLPENFDDYIKTAFSEQASAIQDVNERLKTEVDLLEKQLDLLDKESEQYQKVLNTVKDLQSRQAVSALKNIDLKQMKEDIQKLLPDGMNADDFFSFSSYGGIQANWEKITSSEFAEKILVSYENIVQTQTEWANTISSAYEAVTQLQETYLKDLEQEVEAENEILEKRKEIYENYFDEIDALEEEQERTQSKQDIITQLAALSTGVDGATKSKIKDLQGQLNDLMQKEIEAQREAARDEVLQDIDEQIEANNTQLDNNTNALKALTVSILQGTYGKLTAEEMRAKYEELVNTVPHNAQGGLVDYTGLTWVDGTKTRPEAFLSADDTAHIRTMLDAFSIILSSSIPNIEHSDVTDSIFNNNNSVNIENITIKTEHLNNNQDFKTAGTTLAEEFAAVIRERGLNVNVRK